MDEAARQGSGYPSRRRRAGRGEAARRATGVSSSATAARILVVDDEPALRDKLGAQFGGVEADEGELPKRRERLAADLSRSRTVTPADVRSPSAPTPRQTKSSNMNSVIFDLRKGFVPLKVFDRRDQALVGVGLQ